MLKYKILLISLLFSSCLSALDKIVVASGEWSPYASQSIENLGVTNDLFTRAVESQGVKVEYQWFPWKRGFILTKGASVDVTFPWVKSKEREKDFLFSDKILDINTVFYKLKENPVKWEKNEDLQGLIVLGTNGYNYSDFINQSIESKFFFYDVGATDEVNLRKLISKRGDLFPCAKPVCDYILKTKLSEKERQKLTTIDKPLSISTYYVLVSKKNKNAEKIIEVINKGLKEVKK